MSALETHDFYMRGNTTIVLDGNPSHTSKATRRVLGHLGVEIMYSSPASFQCLPIEGLFEMLMARNIVLEKDNRNRC